MRAISIAPWAMAALLWAPVAFMGGLGFAPLLFLMCLFLAFQPKELQAQGYIWALAASLLFVTVSLLWSPYESGLVEVNFAEGKYAVKATSLRLGLVALLGAVVIGAAHRVCAEDAALIRTFFLSAFVLQAVVILITVYFAEPLWPYFLPHMDHVGEGVQNIGRNAAIFAAATPLLMVAVKQGWLGVTGPIRHWIVLAIAAIVTLHLVMLDSVAGAGAVILATAFIYAPIFKRPGGWKVLGLLTAAYILTAPILFSVLISVIGEGKQHLPLSAWWRIDTWSYTITDIISQKPWFGWGLDSLRSFTDPFPDGRWKGEMQIPNHPHNMLLHIWAEGGFVGALLAAGACWLLGLRIATIQEPTKTGWNCAAGLWAAAIVVCSSSFSLWNDWWWSLVGLLGAVAVLMDKAARRESVRE